MATIDDVKLRREANKDLYTRMDADRNLYYMDPYVLKDVNNKAVKGVRNVTLNYPAIFAAHVQSALMGAKQQIKVSGKDLKDEQTAPVEEFLRALFRHADMLLTALDEPTHRPFVTEQINLRGRSAVRVTTNVNPDGTITVPPLLPMDTRYFTHEMGKDGMEWGAYTTDRTPALIKSEYPGVDIKSGIVAMPVTDLWDRDTNKVYLDEKEIVNRPNPYGYPPFPLRRVQLGSMLKDKDSQAHESESLFFLIRKLIEERNFLATVFQTLNLGSIFPAETWHSDEGTQAEVPEGGTEPGAVTAADKGGGFQIVPTGDIKNSGRSMQGELNSGIQMGSLSTSDYGSVSSPMSAVALVQLAEASGEVFLPRLAAKGLLLADTAWMMIRQIIDSGASEVKLGTRGHAQTFKVADLKGDYDIDFAYTVKSPQTDIALMSVAEAAIAIGFDRDTVMREIIKVENPTEIRERKRSEEAEELSPGLKLYRTAKSLIAQGRELEAQIIAEEMGITLDQVVTGEVVPPATNGNGSKPQPVRNIPLMGTKSASNTQAAQLAAEPGPEVGEEG